MTGVELLTRSESAELAELRSEVARLRTFIDEAMPVWTETLARVAVVERLLPRRRVTSPPDWLGAKDAAPASGMSLSDFYRKWRKLGIIGVKFDRYFMFDPSSFPVRK